MSADPIWEDYLGTSPNELTNGGMFNTKNMNLYNYTMYNPINLMDPDGKRVIYFEAGGGVSVDLLGKYIEESLKGTPLGKILKSSPVKIAAGPNGVITSIIAFDTDVSKKEVWDLVSNFEGGLEGSINIVGESESFINGSLTLQIGVGNDDATIEDLSGNSTQKTYSLSASFGKKNAGLKYSEITPTLKEDSDRSPKFYSIGGMLTTDGSKMSVSGAATTSKGISNRQTLIDAKDQIIEAVK